jgi:cytochrome b subunit of formate dehydrogenase
VTTIPAAILRLSPNQRAQHALLSLTIFGALGTGLVLGRPPGTGAAAAGAWHMAAGLGSLGLLGYHLLYLVVLGYLESRGWASFPLRWNGNDFTAAVAAGSILLGRTEEQGEAGEYRFSQKALYWWTIAALVVLGATGLGVGYWSSFGTLPLLPRLAALHRGCALLLLASVLWHLYGVLTWEGRWWPEWSWITGALDADKARLKVPGAWRRQIKEDSERAAAGAAVSPEETTRVRQTQEKAQVQEDLERGNRLAHEERYVEALYHYRRALESYPGYSQARYNMARVLARMGEREMAREAYREFLAADPFHPLARKAQEALRELDDDRGRQP